MFQYMHRDIEDNAFLDWLSLIRNGNIRALFVHGARQVGKTTTVQHFAKEHFENIYYINLMENREVNIDLKQRSYSNSKEPLCELISIWSESEFIDSENSVIIFDEIQSAPEVYGNLRLFTRGLKSNVILTGSYLAYLAVDSVFIPAGDTYDVYMTGLTFKEFLKASNYSFLIEIIETNLASLLPFSYDIHEQLLKLFSVYLSYGGYPEIISSYLNDTNRRVLSQILNSNIDRFCDESIAYVKDIDEKLLLRDVMCNIPKVILTREHITTKVSKVTELIKGVDKTHNRIDNKVVRSMIGWLLEAHMITQSYRCSDLNASRQLKGEGRIYLKDSGLANEILGQDTSAIGIIVEGYICTVLEDMFSENMGRKPEPISFIEEPGLEVDFFVNSIYGKTAIEVKAGSNMKNKGSIDLLKNKKIDFIIRTGTSNLGKEGNILTVPLYAFSFLKIKNRLEATFFQSEKINKKSSLSRMTLE